MKNAIIGFVFILLFSGCSKQDENKIENPNLIGTWRLIELYQDPGDGSGTYEPVKSDKTVEFKSDGTIVSNGLLCGISTSSNNPTSGTFSVTDSIISPSNCDHNAWFSLINNNLIIRQPCYEGCGEKYVRQ